MTTKPRPERVGDFREERKKEKDETVLNKMARDGAKEGPSDTGESENSPWHFAIALCSQLNRHEVSASEHD